MGQIRLNIDGREVTGFAGQTILDIARENNISIPTLCHDDRVQMYGSCGICVVEAEGNPRLLRACSTMAAQGMVIMTHTDRVRASRKTALELLLSDHRGDCRPPCLLACPAQTDCQGYVGLIANGEYEEAYRLIKDKIPLPGSIGRVCPHPCEDACRRTLVEQPISIAALKTFAAHQHTDDVRPETEARDSGRKVAIVGGGPGGLSAAYFLRLKGHAVTIYDAMPHMGGMLRYGIPEYRLPKQVLQQEIDSIQKMGVVMRNHVKIGRDITLAHLRETYDAVILAVGAWTSTTLRCPGEDLDGVFGGIDFLRDAALQNPMLVGGRVAVIGGGNTAMDACRTLVRLGAEEVTNIYRRTRAEMPAEEEEIKEAEQEGVRFLNLRNPLAMTGENGRVSAISLQVMALGQPDASGRRAPVPVEGRQETLAVDAVIIAIGQRLDAAGLEDVALTSRQTIAADEAFRTNLDGVFAIGDAINKGADIAIAAIGHAKKAAEAVHHYLAGEPLGDTEGYRVRTEPTAEDFADRAKQPRVQTAHRDPGERKGDFLAINHILTPEQAGQEAARCLECGCADFFECKLIDLANQYDVRPEKYAGQTHKRDVRDDHPFIRRNPDKCILCGLCARVCEEVVGQTALGLVGRGFDTLISPAGVNLGDAGCISCGLCVHACPTGALTETLAAGKQVPVRESSVQTTCSFCSVGCQQKLTHVGKTALRALPSAARQEDALLCVKGRFGLNALSGAERITQPMIRTAGQLRPVSYEQAIVFVNKKLQGLQTRYGQDSIAVTVSDRYTNEEALLIREYAHKALRTANVFSFSKADGGVGPVLGRDGSTVDWAALSNTDCILLVQTDIHKPHLVAGLAVKKAVQNGAKLIVMNTFDSAADSLAQLKLNPGGDLSLLKQMVKLALSGARRKDIAGMEALAAAVADVVVTPEAQAAAELYGKAANAVIMFTQNAISPDAAGLLAGLAVLSGQLDRPRAGIIQLKPGANAQGLADLGVRGRGELLEGITSRKVKGLFLFGEDMGDIDLKTEFLAVQDLFLTKTAQKADVVFPGQSYAETDGTFTNTIGARQRVRAAIPGLAGQDSFALLTGLAGQAGYAMPYRDMTDVERAVTAAADAGRRHEERRLWAPSGDHFLPEQDVESTNVLYVRFMDLLRAQGLS